MQPDPHAIQIYTDGSCYKNPGGRSGCAAVVRFPDAMGTEDEQIVDWGTGESNISRMELLACIKTMEWVRDNRERLGGRRVQIITDSRYVADNVPRAERWKRNGWRNRDERPMDNPDLWTALLRSRKNAGLRIDFAWTLGKKSDILKRVDKAAKTAAKSGDRVDRGFRGGQVARSMVKGVASMYPASGQNAVIRPYKKQVLLRGENKVRFDVFDEETEQYIAKFYAYCNADIALDLHRANHYRVAFNENPRYPQILAIVESIALRKCGSEIQQKR
jgi:ribonuclease HI